MKAYKFDDVINILLNEGYEYVEGDYNDAQSIFTLSDFDGFIYNTSFSRFMVINKRKGKLLKFGESNPNTIFNINLWIEKNKKEFLLMSNIYTNSEDRNISLKCKNCGNTWKDSWSHIYQGSKCKVCFRKELIDNLRVKGLTKDRNLLVMYPDICKEWDWETNKTFPEDYTPHSNRKVGWVCKNCGGKYTSSIGNRTLNGNSCPFCYRSKNSKGENAIKNFLSKNNILFIEQKRFKECRNIGELPFDFYLPDLNVCIEYQGKQHYENSFGRGSKDLRAIQKNDKIKKEFCINNNISYLEIQYLNFKFINEILSTNLM